MSQEEPGGARRSQEEPGEARRSQEEPGEARRSQEKPRRSQEKRGVLLVALFKCFVAVDVFSVVFNEGCCSFPRVA